MPVGQRGARGGHGGKPPSGADGQLHVGNSGPAAKSEAVSGTQTTLEGVLRNLGRVRLLTAGETLTRAGDADGAMWQIIDGGADLLAPLTYGGSVVLDRALPGAWLGATAAIEGAAALFTAAAVGTTTARHVDGVVLRATLSAQPSLWPGILAIQQAETRALIEMAGETLALSARARILRRLLRLTAHREEVCVTQSALGEMVGTTRTTVHRILKAAENDGLVSLGYGAIRLQDRRAVEAAAAIDE
jgi:CRP-like cAMP-binding protein